MSTENHVERLLGKGYLAEFERDELQRIVDASEPRTLLSSETIWAPGESREAAYILVRGGIERTVRMTEDRRTDTYKTVGQILSLSALVHDWEYHSAAHAVCKTEVLVLTRERFQEMFEAGDSAAYRLTDQIAAYLVRDMRRANARLQTVFGQPAETLRMLKRRLREDTKA